MESSYMLPPNKSVSGFGITSLILGSIALVICWIPLLGCLALPLGVLGLIFGIVGLIVANTGKKQGLGMPVGGVGGFGSGVAWVWVGCMVLGRGVSFDRHASAAASCPTCCAGPIHFRPNHFKHAGCCNAAVIDQ